MPTVVIKSVSDYADSHKNDGWQKFAAASAAACMKAFMNELPFESEILESVDTPGKEISVPADFHPMSKERCCLRRDPL